MLVNGAYRFGINIGGYTYRVTWRKGNRAKIQTKMGNRWKRVPYTLGEIAGLHGKAFIFDKRYVSKTWGV